MFPMNAGLASLPESVVAIVSIAPAEKPTMPMRSGSTRHCAARARMSAKAARASASCGARFAIACAGSGGAGRAAPENISRIARSKPGMSAGVWIESVLQHERGDAPGGERPGDIPALIFHGKRPKASARRDDHGGAGRPGRVRKKGRERRDRDVAREAAAILAVP